MQNSHGGGELSGAVSEPGSWPVAQEELWAAIARISEGVVFRDDEGNVLYANPAACEIAGVTSPADLATARLKHWRICDDAGELAEMPVLAVGRDGASWVNRVFRVCREGRPVLWLSSQAYPIALRNGRRGSLSIFSDITAGKQAQAKAEADARALNLITASASDLLWSSDRTGRCRWISPSVARILGRRPEELQGSDLMDLVHLEDIQRALLARAAGREGRTVSLEVRLRRADGSYCPLDLRVGPYRNEAGELDGSFISARDISVERKMRETLNASEERFRATLRSAPLGMAVADARGRFQQVNPALCELLGRHEDELLGCTYDHISHPDDAAIAAAMRAELLSDIRTSVTREQRLTTAAGPVWVLHAMSKLSVTGAEPLFISQFLMSDRDPLTELFNRRALMANVQTALANCDPRGAGLGVLYCDLDGLKGVNDGFGHDAGDQLLVAVAGRLRGAVRRYDTVARMGGDEFVVLVPGVSGIADAARIADHIRTSIAQVYLISGHSIHISMSIGVALAPPGSNPSAALRAADAAMYRAKSSGGDQVEVAA